MHRPETERKSYARTRLTISLPVVRATLAEKPARLHYMGRPMLPGLQIGQPGATSYQGRHSLRDVVHLPRLLNAPRDVSGGRAEPYSLQVPPHGLRICMRLEIGD